MPRWMTPVSIAVAAGAVLSGCAQSYQPIIDRKYVDERQYGQDLAECRQYAEQVSPAREAVGGGLLGGAIGAAVGAATGAVFGNPALGAAAGGASGGTAGVARGALGGARGQRQVIRNCLSGRGYKVLR